MTGRNFDSMIHGNDQSRDAVFKDKTTARIIKDVFFDMRESARGIWPDQKPVAKGQHVVSVTLALLINIALAVLK